MKISIKLLVLLFPMVASAEAPTGISQGMSQQNTQMLMQQMQKMQSCMKDVDQSEMQALSQRANQLTAEIKKLCAKGKRGQAQKKALSFGKEMSQKKSMKTMKKCAEIMEGLMQKMPFPDFSQEYADKNVCDASL